jgi:hypothetical protein
MTARPYCPVLTSVEGRSAQLSRTSPKKAHATGRDATCSTTQKKFQGNRERRNNA